MRRIAMHSTTLLLTALVLSCSDDFLDVNNKNFFTVDGYYTKREHAFQAIVASYDALKGNGLYGLRYPFFANCLGDEAVFERAIYSELIFDTDDEYVKFIFGYTYRGIAKTNLALEKIPQIEDPALEPEIKERLIAEAKFLRALYNFIAHTTFNEPPLITSVVSDMNALYGNSTWEEYRAQIEKDLLGFEQNGQWVKGAIEVLPIEYDDANLGRATKGAALTLLGRTYLYHQEWDLAKEYLQQVIDLGIYELIQPMGTDSIDYVNAYLCNFSSEPLPGSTGEYRSDFNSESVFEIIFKNTDFVRNYWLPGWMSDGLLYSAFVSVRGYRNISPTAKFSQSFEETPHHTARIRYDPRRYATIYSEGDTISYDPYSRYNIPFNPSVHAVVNTGYGVRKYVYPLHEDPPAPFNSSHNWKVFRYSDVLLMLAEAEYNINGSTPLALNAINTVRARAGLPLLETLTTEAIMNERMWELGLEGHRYFDLVRWGRAGGEWPKPTEHREFFIEGKHEFLPIPQTEISRMQGKLKQNPGW